MRKCFCDPPSSPSVMVLSQLLKGRKKGADDSTIASFTFNRKSKNLPKFLDIQLVKNTYDLERVTESL